MRKARIVTFSVAAEGCPVVHFWPQLCTWSSGQIAPSNLTCGFTSKIFFLFHSYGAGKITRRTNRTMYVYSFKNKKKKSIPVHKCQQSCDCKMDAVPPVRLLGSSRFSLSNCYPASPHPALAAHRACDWCMGGGGRSHI